MTLADTHVTTAFRPRVGIPWRTSDDEVKAKVAGVRGKTEDYLKAVEKAGGEGVPVPLKDEEERNRLIPTLDAFVLPGSPADVDPEVYGQKAGNSNKPDKRREATDRAILKFALDQRKPVLAICYGFQILNVYQGGSLIQDIRAELKDKIKNLSRHRKQDPPASADDPQHDAIIEQGTRLASLAGGMKAIVNSSHHQAIDKLGHDLKIAARAADGIIEGFEWIGDSNWVVGVQWHPERMPNDPLAQRLFQEFVAAARSREAVAHKT